MRELLMTALFKSDLDSLDHSIRERVAKSIRQIQDDPYYPGLRTKATGIYQRSQNHAFSCQ